MLVTPFYKGQGLGNQLANYVTTRCIALDKGYEFGVMFPERFKAASFMNLDMGKPVIGGVVPVEGQEPSVLPDGVTRYYREAMIGNGDYDPEIFNITDNTIIHGNLQGEEYFKHRKNEIREWLEPIDYTVKVADDTCIINFRGGEYKYVPEFFLPQDYWDTAMAEMRKINPAMRFVVVTDDVETASKFFNPLYIEITHDMPIDYISILNAPYLILSNSSFGWFPAWLNTNVKKIIAPKFWGRHNKGYWFLEQNKTEGFDYI